jgi:CBS domain-containing protein
MKVRYYIDPATGQPHIYNHDVAESEVEEVLDRPGEDRAGSDGSRVAIGRTRAGRLLRVIYVADLEPKSVFVITAYDLRGKPALAYRRRRRNLRP